jgi:hypothetical protein
MRQLDRGMNCRGLSGHARDIVAKADVRRDDGAQVRARVRVIFRTRRDE